MEINLDSILQSIKSPDDVKKLSHKELTKLSGEIRSKIIEVVGKNGGHLASNLGVVELTIALHRVFNSPEDALVWDVSHQSYAHKLLTGRYGEFDTIRIQNGLSGFTNINESIHDFFTAGHSSTSISSALGLLTSWENEKKEGKVVAIIGDGALTGGLAFEGLEHAGQLSKNLIVVLNDNQMSIDHNTGAVSRYLSRLTMTAKYQTFRYRVDKVIDRIPYINKGLEKIIFRLKRSLKGLFLTNNLFVDLGFEYVGPLNGHNIDSLENVFRRVKKLHRPVVVHVVTKKGKGYSPAEDHPDQFHGIGPFAISEGNVETFEKLSFTESFSESMCSIAKANRKVCGITAAMAKGTGLSAFARKYPDRFFDVGIAEGHAVTFAGGLARGGMIPVVCIYSTFIQRAVDQMIHDIALQKAHAVFVLDRSGAVPNDGATHQGVFDISLFRCIPNINILSPVSDCDLHLCLKWAVNKQEEPVIIRYPKASCPHELAQFSLPVSKGKGIFVPAEEFARNEEEKEKIQLYKKEALIVCTGGVYTEVSEAVRKFLAGGKASDIYILRFIKPLDEKYFVELCGRYKKIVFVEDGMRSGGISEYLSGLLAMSGKTETRILAFDDRFYSHGTRQEINIAAGIDSDSIFKAIAE